MVSDTQRALTEEEQDERELEDVDAAYLEELGNPEEAAEDMQAELKRKEKEGTGAEYQKILIALGLTRYDNKEKGISCKLKMGVLQVGRTFTEKHPTGNMWVKCLEDSAFGKKDDFLKRDACMKIPLVKLFYDIRNGELPIPEPTVSGKVVGKSDKAVQIQFAEFGQIRSEWWGFGALKVDKEGVHYVPASYAKETKHYTAKMQVPRDLILANYEEEFKDAEITTTATDTGKHEEEVKKGEVESGTVADKIPAPESESREEAIANIMKTYLEKGREMVEQIFPELEQPQLSELSQDIATSMFIEDRKEARKERW